MNTQGQDNRPHGFVAGLLTGALIGGGLAVWFTPRLAAELRRRATDAARDASVRIGEAVDELTRKSEDARDDVADAVANGARAVGRYAKAAKTERVAHMRKRSAL